MPPQLTRSSILHKAGYDPSDALFVYPFGRDTPLGDHEAVPLQLHGMITFRLSGTGLGDGLSFAGLLSEPDRWDITVELPTGQPWHRANHVCVVLPDRVTSFMLLPERRQHYLEDLSQAFDIPLSTPPSPPSATRRWMVLRARGLLLSVTISRMFRARPDALGSMSLLFCLIADPYS